MSVPVSSFVANRQLTPFHQDIAGAVSSGDVGDVGNAASQEKAIATLKSQFAEQFRELASNPEKFHQLLSIVFGPNIDRDMAVTLRRKALQGDFSWVPDVEVVSDETLRQGDQQGLGAYDAERNVIYLGESLLNDPELAQKIFNEEVGHALDQMLNTTDTRGDEGDLFSRMLNGETLSAEEVVALRNENDHGVINVNGREVAVEFGIFSRIGKAIKRAVNAVGNAIGRIGNAISNVWHGVWDGVKDLMASRIFQALMFAAQYIPMLTPVAVAMRIATAAYQAYQGIKSGNLTQAVLGALSAVSSAVTNAKVLGLSASTANTLSTVSQYGQYGVAAYQAHQTGRLDALILTALNKAQPGTNLDQLKGVAELYQKAMAVKASLRQGDDLSALLAGVNLAGKYVDGGNQWGQALATIRDIGGNIRMLEQTIKHKNWNQAADLIMNDVLRYSGMAAADLDNLGKLLRLASTAATVDQRVKENDWAGVGLSVMEAGYQLSDDAGLQQQLVRASSQVKQLNSLFTALQGGQYDAAAQQLNTLLGDPLQAGDALLAARKIGVDAVAINQALKMGDLDRATALVERRLGDGSVEDIRQFLQMAGDMNGALSKIPGATPINAAGETHSEAPFMQLPAGEKLALLQVLQTAVKSDRYEDTAVLLNASLGKHLSAEQWAEKLTGSGKVLEGPVLQTVKQGDWSQAVNILTGEIGQYLPVDPAVADDAVRLTQMAEVMGESMAEHAGVGVAPKPSAYHTVEARQTLSQLVSDTYGVGYDPELIQLVARHNGLADAHSLQVGQQLELPTRETLVTLAKDADYSAAYDAKAATYAAKTNANAVSQPTQVVAPTMGGNGSAETSPSAAGMSPDQKIDLAGTVAGYVTTASTSAVTAAVTHVQQKTIKGPVEHVISRLEQTGDPAQIEKANALREANRAPGLKGILHPDAVDYSAKNTLEARNQVLSDKSVIGGKLARDLGKASHTLDLADNVIKKAGIVGTVAGPVIGSVTEVAKLDDNATAAEKITAGIVGAVKNVDNAVVGVTAGGVTGVLTSLTGPGAVVVASAAGVGAETVYKQAGGDDKFNTLVDKSVAPTIQSAVEAGLDAADAIADTAAGAVNAVENTFDAAVEAGAELVDDIGESITSTYNDLVREDTDASRP